MKLPDLFLKTKEGEVAVKKAQIFKEWAKTQTLLKEETLRIVELAYSIGFMDGISHVTDTYVGSKEEDSSYN